MGWTPFQLSIAFVMLITGSLNTLIAKWTDDLKAVGRVHTDKDPRSFNHPFLQACAMFLGEFLCLGAFGVIWLVRRRISRSGSVEAAEVTLGEGQEHFTWRKMLVFLPPALCDMTATSIMYVGLNMTYASSFQMLRGAVIIFTALLSVAFLNNRLGTSKWIGMFIVIAGLALVGVADIVFGGHDAAGMNKVITGDLLIIMAQIVAACQMVYEEKFLSKYDVPALVAVGLEGLFGFVILSLLLIPMAYIPAGSFSDTPYHTIEDPIDAFYQMGNNPAIIGGLVGTIFSIAFFNYAGITVTKEINATTRMVLDSLRTLIIWGVSLGLGWQKFQYLQVIGFVLLILGMSIYNQILTTNLVHKIRVKITRRGDGREVLVEEEVVEDGRK